MPSATSACVTSFPACQIPSLSLPAQPRRTRFGRQLFASHLSDRSPYQSATQGPNPFKTHSLRVCSGGLAQRNFKQGAVGRARARVSCDHGTLLKILCRMARSQLCGGKCRGSTRTGLAPQFAHHNLNRATLGSHLEVHMSDRHFSHEMWLSKLRDHLAEERYAAGTSRQCLAVARHFLRCLDKQHVDISAAQPANVE